MTEPTTTANAPSVKTADTYVRMIQENVDNGAPFGWENRNTGETVSNFDDLAEALDLAPRVLDDMLCTADRIADGDDGDYDAETIENARTRDEIMGDWEPASPLSYLSDVLSIRYTVTGREADDYLGADVAIAIGGPNVWIDTSKATLTVHWGGEPVTRNVPTLFAEGLDEAAGELWGMGA